jgi:hypothetical protein
MIKLNWQCLKSRKLLAAIAVLVCFVVSGFLLPLIIVSEWSQEMCALCGSKRGAHSFLGISHKPYYNESPVEAWRKKKGRPCQHQWVFMSRTGKGILGKSCSFSCGIAPDIYLLASYPKLMEWMVNNKSDDEIETILTIMAGGSRQQAHDFTNKLFEEMTAQD